MAQQKRSAERHDTTKKAKHSPSDTQSQNNEASLTGIPKPESSSEYEGAPSRKPTGNQPVEKKTETSRSSGQ